MTMAVSEWHGGILAREGRRSRRRDVDLHQAFFQACAVGPDGVQLWEQRFPRSAAGIAAFVTRCHRQTAVAVEASTPTWHFADALVPHVGELRIVDAAKTRLKAGYAAKRTGWMRAGWRMRCGARASSASTIRPWRRIFSTTPTSRATAA